MGTEYSVKAWGGMEVERRESMGEKKRSSEILSMIKIKQTNKNTKENMQSGDTLKL